MPEAVNNKVRPDKENHLGCTESTVPLKTKEPHARDKTSSLPNVFTANSPRWDENRNRGKDESNQKPRWIGRGKNTIVTNYYCMSIVKHYLTFHPLQAL